MTSAGVGDRPAIVAPHQWVRPRERRWTLVARGIACIRTCGVQRLVRS